MPDFVHELVVAWLIGELHGWARDHRATVAASGAKFQVAETTGRKPDLTVFLEGTPRPPSRGLIRQPPDIAVEVVSPSARDGRRDRIEKVQEYAAFGIRWYWLLDPTLRTLEILELHSSGHYLHAVSGTGGVIAPPGCEGLALPLDELWATMDGLPGDSSPE